MDTYIYAFTMVCTCSIHIYLYNGTLFSLKMRILSLVTTQMNVEDIKLSDISHKQRERDKHHTISYVEFKRVEFTEEEGRMTRAWGRGKNRRGVGM
jgi:hypothetical protein